MKFPIIINEKPTITQGLNLPLLCIHPPFANKALTPQNKLKLSFDINCIQTQVYLAFLNINVQTSYAFSASASPSNTLPFLIDNQTEKAYAGEGLVDYLQNITPSSLSLDLDDSAFIALADSKIGLALKYTLYCDERTWKNLTKNLETSVEWPLNFILPWLKRNKIVKELLGKTVVLNKQEIFEDADSALEALSVRLGAMEYFDVSQSPKLLDSVVFAYLYSILSILSHSYSSLELVKLVLKYDNLVLYTDAVRKEYKFM